MRHNPGRDIPKEWHRDMTHCVIRKKDLTIGIPRIIMGYNLKTGEDP
jgi:hypothetical protein